MNILKPKYWLSALAVVAACGAGISEEIVDAISKSFETGVSQGQIENPAINEASGIAEGINNAGMLWTHNDSGGKPRIFLIDEHGKDKGTYQIQGVKNRDWEDIATGPGPEKGKNYIYIAETGDNLARFEDKYIYRFEEPMPGTEKVVSKVDKISIVYPDGKRDAECLMVDPLTKDLYIVSKREKSVSVYKVVYPQAVDKDNKMEKVCTIPLNNVVAGDISSDGLEILIKTYSKIYYWNRDANTSIADALMKEPSEIPYTAEPQGEAIAWKKDGSGFFTLSEEPLGLEAMLYYYKRK